MAEQVVKIQGVVQTTTASGGSGGPVDQGTAAATAGAWPIKVTDGSNIALVSSGALQVALSSSPTVNQGTPAASTSAWPIVVSNGASQAAIAVPTGSVGQGLIVANGTSGVHTSLTTATAVANGTTIDFGATRCNITMALIVNGTVTGGDVDLQISQDNTNWITIASTAGVGIQTGVNKFLNSTVTVSATTSVQHPAARYARARVTNTITGGGSVTATIAAC